MTVTASGVGMLFWSQLILIVALSLCIYKKQFVQPDGVSISLLEEDLENPSETFTFSAIWMFKQRNGSSCYRPENRSMYVLLLLLCEDIEFCPGPSETYVGKFMNCRGMKIFHQNMFDLYASIDVMTLSETHIIDRQYDDVDQLSKSLGIPF